MFLYNYENTFHRRTVNTVIKARRYRRYRLQSRGCRLQSRLQEIRYRLQFPCRLLSCSLSASALCGTRQNYIEATSCD